MLECLIIGDSLGVGIGYYRPECAIYAKVGRTSAGAVSRHKSYPLAKQTIISLGSNDYKDVSSLRSNLNQVRKKLIGRNVIWILPRNSDAARKIVISIADQYHDHVIDASTVPGDRVHPNKYGYYQLAKKIKKGKLK